MATKSYSPHSQGSGHMRASGNPWSVPYGAASANVSSENRSFVAHVAETDGYDIRRIFLSFDTSSLPTSADITGATITATWTVQNNGDNDGSDYLIVSSNTQADPEDLEEVDWDQVAETAHSNTIDMTGKSGTQTFTLDESGIAEIDPDGFSLYTIREGHDYTNVAVADDTENTVVLTDILLNVTYKPVAIMNAKKYW